MTTRSTTNNKMGKLYAELSPTERVRMLAKLSKAHDTAEIARLRNATPAEHADTYNRALGLLRVLNGHALDWIAIFQIGMERDRMRLQHALSEEARHRLAVLSLYKLWKVVSYPVTESEYRAIVKLERAELESVNNFADLIWDTDNLRPELQAIVQEYRDAEEPSEAEQEAFWKGYEARIVAAVKAAIKRGELPKPKPAPKDSVNAEPGDIWLPTGALRDWAEGTTEATYRPHRPGYAVPFLGEVLGGDMGTEWDIRPDSEAEAVKARRELIRDAFLAMRNVHHDERALLPSLDPPLTAKDHERAQRIASELHDALDIGRDLAPFVLDVAKTHATHRAQLEDISEAIETIRREDFGGEDPLWPEVRAILEKAQAEARRFDETWESAHAIMRSHLREAAGLEGYPRDSWNPETETFDIEPVPLPEGEHDLEGTLKLIYGWAD